MADENDRRWLAAALRLGETALGTTWPNPAVGAILVRDRVVVGRGHTAPGGRPHAEPLALRQAGSAAHGATLYVSLEPCSHHGRSPPCADAVIAAGVSRVVAALTDPNPPVAGSGLARLRSAGIAVETNVLPEAGARAHAGHLSRVTRGRPHVCLKLAVSADGAIGRVGEPQTPVTGALARRHVQALRARFDAIAVGAGTLAADRPLLTVRLPGMAGRSPVRVLFGGSAAAARELAADRAAPVWLFGSASGKVDGGEGLIRSFAVAAGSGGLDLHAALATLSGEGITRLLVEGGARLARSLLEADLVDEVLLFRGPVLLGGGPLGAHAVPALAGLPLEAITGSARFRLSGRRWFGADRLEHFERSEACSPAS